MFSRLYVHVPFCLQKCHYCAFVSVTADKDELEEYPSLLTRELHLSPPSVEPLVSIYFGGGTPSLLQPLHLQQFLVEVAKRTRIVDDAEITLEVNPGTADSISLQEFRKAGINRISLGVQSFDDLFLKRLGRIHSAGQAIQAFMAARNAGFSNISIDLIHSLPGQSLTQWRTDVQHALSLCPEHVSIYGLSVEDGTRFAHMYPPDSPLLPDHDLSADMFEAADELLTASGLEHYEIANYARPGCRSQHNSGYWRRDGYRGVGVAAHSFLRDGYGTRFSNPGTLDEYRHGINTGTLVRIDEHQLTRKEAMAEYLFLGLRLTDGVSRSAFEHEFGASVESAYDSEIADLVNFGLLIDTGSWLALSRRGRLLSNQVFNRFV